MANDTVLVTGAAGHLGNNIVRALLARGRKVRVLEHVESASLDGLPVEKRRGDILDRPSLDAACEGVAVVYHFAATVSIAPAHDARDVIRTNTLGTKNVVDACLAQGVETARPRQLDPRACSRRIERRDRRELRAQPRPPRLRRTTGRKSREKRRSAPGSRAGSTRSSSIPPA